MKKARILMALLTTAALAMTMNPGSAGVKKKTLGTQRYDLANANAMTDYEDPTCTSLRNVPVTEKDFPPPSTVTGRIPDEAGDPPPVPGYPVTPRRVPEPAGSQLPAGCQVAADGTFNVGGVRFRKIGGSTKWATVKLFITDESGTPVRFNLAQDFDGDGFTGEEPDETNPDQVRETSYVACSPGAPYMRVNTRYEIVVFINNASTGCQYLDEAEDTYLGTRGIVKLVRYWR